MRGQPCGTMVVMKSQGGRGRVLRFAVTGALLGGAAGGCTGAQDQPRTNTAHVPEPDHVNMAREAEPAPEPDHVNVAPVEPPPDAEPSPDAPPKVMVNPAPQPDPEQIEPVHPNEAMEPDPPAPKPDHVNVRKEPDPPTTKKAPEPKHVNVRKEPDPKLP